MKMKLKVSTAILMSLFLVSVIAVSTHAKPADTKRLLMIDIMAKGEDADLLGNTTSIIAKIEFDKDGEALGRVEFHIKIYDESGEKVYSMKGKLKNGVVFPGIFDCSVRHVRWINLWFVMGEGMIRTTDIDLEILYRGQLITLPNTGGKYVPATIAMMVSPEGEYVEIPGDEIKHGFFGGWVYAGIMDFDEIAMFGGVTALTKYMEKWVP